MKLLLLLGVGLATVAAFAAQDEFPNVPAEHWANEKTARSAQMSPFSSVKVDYLPFLLFNPKVQQDMHLSPAVVQQEQTLIIQLGMQMMPLAQKAATATPDQRQQMMKAYENMESKTVAPLTPAQRARLHQLTLQFLGPSALAMPSVAEQVGLTKAQKAKVSQIVAASAGAMRGHMPMGGGADATAQFGAMGKSMHQARAVAEGQIDKVLTPAQKAKWSAMQGRKLPGVTEFGGMGM